MSSQRALLVLACSINAVAPSTSHGIAPSTIWASSAWPALDLSGESHAPLDFSGFSDAMHNMSAELGGLGIAVVAFDGGGEQILNRTYGKHYCKTVEWCDGFDEGEITSETQIPVFSNTKIVSAMVFLKTIGLEGLDIPLSASLPDPFAKPGSFGGAVTPRHILSHTGGFIGVDDANWLSANDCFDRYECSPNYDANSTMTLERCIKQISEYPLVAEPGAEWVYSDWGYDILALLVQRKTGLRFEDAFQVPATTPPPAATTSAPPSPQTTHSIEIRGVAPRPHIVDFRMRYARFDG